MTKPKELPDAWTLLGKVLPDDEELVRLVHYFPSYNREHRTKILEGFFDEKSIDAILAQKFKVDPNIDEATISSLSLRGHKGWAHKRIKYTLIRLLYLRYLKDKKLEQRMARSRVWLFHVPKIMGKDLSRSRFNEITYSPEIPEE
ncbi:MAG: hypothetical protein VYE54_00745 [Pseudomonadota bacterium]|nr:hypothetical protein [Pseudomonadota bacterium]